MQDLAIEIAQIALVAMQAAWLTLGALDNIRHPSINRDDVAKVLALDAIADEPAILKKVAARRITRPQTVRRLFAFVVTVETAVVLALWVATLGLLLALFGIFTSDLATGFAILAVLAFTSIWASFLIGGQWFYYWYGEHGQKTHFLTTIWGIATIAVLAL